MRDSLKSGASLSQGLLPGNDRLWMEVEHRSSSNKPVSMPVGQRQQHRLGL
ncbi:hypothetical protein QBC46DRAFT_345005 [Diplogelasinospora grovesii]|uniref:Uncharacterized protein n=1 Tax=Diplogelasinospora grovesii TaxID=303347 RepID=A0AAN6N292_9PEZI|nr:hypothetical protein QBC46DRAFT_345005 [Diplogelasinospora grovesii]